MKFPSFFSVFFLWWVPLLSALMSSRPIVAWKHLNTLDNNVETTLVGPMPSIQINILIFFHLKKIFPHTLIISAPRDNMNLFLAFWSAHGLNMVYVCCEEDWAIILDCAKPSTSHTLFLEIMRQYNEQTHHMNIHQMSLFDTTQNTHALPRF